MENVWPHPVCLVDGYTMCGVSGCVAVTVRPHTHIQYSFVQL